MTMSKPVLLQETLDGVRILRLNRPEKMNALNEELVAALLEAMDVAVKEKAIRVIGITGQGRGFCAGADLGGSKSSDSTVDSLDDLGSVGRLVIAVRVACDKPVIAGINGIAIGAGLALAMLADMRIASSAATFNPGYARVATSPDCGLSWTLPQAVGHEHAMRFLLERETVDAQAALKIGLVGEVVETDTFDEAFSAYCKKIASVAPIALQQTKRLVNKASFNTDLESHLRDELRYVNRGLRSEAGQDAMRAIFKPRKPVFKG